MQSNQLQEFLSKYDVSECNVEAESLDFARHGVFQRMANNRQIATLRMPIESVTEIAEQVTEYHRYVVELQHDNELRREYPAVQKAYENYQLVLKIAKEK